MRAAQHPPFAIHLPAHTRTSQACRVVSPFQLAPCCPTQVLPSLACLQVWAFVVPTLEGKASPSRHQLGSSNSWSSWQVHGLVVCPRTPPSLVSRHGQQACAALKPACTPQAKVEKKCGTQQTCPHKSLWKPTRALPCNTNGMLPALPAAPYVLVVPLAAILRHISAQLVYSCPCLPQPPEFPPSCSSSSIELKLTIVKCNACLLH